MTFKLGRPLGWPITQIAHWGLLEGNHIDAVQEGNILRDVPFLRLGKESPLNRR